MKLRKWFTLIEMLIVIIIIWIMMMMSIKFVDIWFFRKQYLINSISNCNFLYIQSKETIKCYIDTNRNNILDTQEINNWETIKLKNIVSYKEFNFIKSLNLKVWNNYFVYKNNYIFNYDKSNKTINSLNSIINL